MDVPTMLTLAFLDLGLTEIIVVGVVALLVFGGDLPDVLRSVGRSYAKLRKSLHEIAEPVRAEVRGVARTMDTPPPVLRAPDAADPATSEVITDHETEPSEAPYPIDAPPGSPRAPSKWDDLLDEPPPV